MFMSGDWAGHDSVLILWSLLHTLIDQTTQSCWKNQSSELGNSVRVKGNLFFSLITLYMIKFLRHSQTKEITLFQPC